MIRAMCGWCHELGGHPGTPCPACGHQVGVSRLDCACSQCAGQATAIRGQFYCWVCRKNPVDALNGQDTCADCLSRQ
jgi:hypothetical protein